MRFRTTIPALMATILATTVALAALKNLTLWLENGI
jgi:hypothetical protein